MDIDSNLGLLAFVVEHYLLTELFGALVIHASVVGFARVTNPYSFLCWDAQDPDALPFFESSPMIGIVSMKKHTISPGLT
jgi:hypothetical protein